MNGVLRDERRGTLIQRRGVGVHVKSVVEVLVMCPQPKASGMPKTAGGLYKEKDKTPILLQNLQKEPTLWTPRFQI